MNAKRLLVGSLILGVATLGGWALWSLNQKALPAGSKLAPRVEGEGSHGATTANAQSFPEGFSIAASNQGSLKEIAAEKDEIKRDHKMQGLVDSIAVGDLPQLVASLTAANQNELTHDLWLRLLRRWGTADPHAAAIWAAALPATEPGNRPEAMNLVAIAWANADLQRAESWVAGWPESAERDVALTAVTYEGARTNPVAAMQYALGLPSSQENDNLITYSASQWATIDPSGAWQWAQDFKNKDSRELLWSNIAVTWAAQDPVAASQVVGKISPGRDQDDAIVGVAQHWVQRDAVAAKEWVLQFPENNAGRVAAVQAIDAYLHYRSKN